jgi:hypothetical protein
LGNLGARGRSLKKITPDFVKNFNTSILSTFRVIPNFPIESTCNVKEEGEALLYLAGEKKWIPRGKAKSWFNEPPSEFEDIEKQVAQYRFSGLIFGLAEKGFASDEDDNLIESWCNSSGDFSGAWEPYTISERISNISAYCMFTSFINRVGEETSLRVANRLVKEAKFLLNDLEVFEDDLTSNHYINNGRAFVWLGSLLGNKNIARLGKNIILDRYSDLIRNGLLREGSIHYHLLLTKNVYEVKILLSHLDLLNEDEIRKIEIKSLLANANQLTSRSAHIPNIGDLSPDCDIEWLKDLGEAASEQSVFSYSEGVKKSWVDLFGVEKKKLVKKPTEILNQEYGVLRDQDFEIFIHRNFNGYSFLPSHSHCDTGSYFLCRNNEVLVWDKGRSSYCDEDEVSSQSSSSILLNGAGPDFRERSFYTDSFKKEVGHRLKVFQQEKGAIRLEVEYPNKVVVNRVYTLESGLKEEISISGRGKKEVSLSLYLAPEATFESREEFSIDETKVAYSYGKEKSVKRYTFRKKVDLPFKFSYEVR